MGRGSPRGAEQIVADLIADERTVISSGSCEAPAATGVGKLAEAYELDPSAWARPATEGCDSTVTFPLRAMSPSSTASPGETAPPASSTTIGPSASSPAGSRIADCQRRS